MRLDKYLAHAGLGTRKEVKLAIRKGRVSVNGEVCRKDDRKIQEGVDVVCLDKEEIYYEAVVYIMLNKPQDVVSATSDPTYETVLDCIDAFLPKDCFPVGRLDMDTEAPAGLIAFYQAAANGKMAITSDTVTTQEYFADGRGALCGRDIEDWKNTIQYFLKHREEADSSAEKFKRFLENECSEKKYAKTLWGMLAERR